MEQKKETRKVKIEIRKLSTTFYHAPSHTAPQLSKYINPPTLSENCIGVNGRWRGERERKDWGQRKRLLEKRPKCLNRLPGGITSRSLELWCTQVFLLEVESLIQLGNSYGDVRAEGEATSIERVRRLLPRETLNVKKDSTRSNYHSFPQPLTHGSQPSIPSLRINAVCITRQSQEELLMIILMSLKRRKSPPPLSMIPTRSFRLLSIASN